MPAEEEAELRCAAEHHAADNINGMRMEPHRKFLKLVGSGAPAWDPCSCGSKPCLNNFIRSERRDSNRIPSGEHVGCAQDEHVQKC